MRAGVPSCCMTPWRSFVEVVHLLALCLWSAGLLAAGLSAALVFPTLKGLSPTLAGFSAEFAQSHYLVAGGSIAQRAFFVSDLISFFGAMVAIVTLAVLIVVHRLPTRRSSTIVRALALALAVASLASMLIIVTPALNTATRLHWAAIKLGDAGSIAERKLEVDQLHPLATNLMVGMLGCVLVALVAGMWALARSDRGEESSSSHAPAGKRTPPKYPVPDLARRGAR